MPASYEWTEQALKNVRDRRERGISYKRIAAELTAANGFNISPNTVRNMCLRTGISVNTPHHVIGAIDLDSSGGRAASEAERRRLAAIHRRMDSGDLPQELGLSMADHTDCPFCVEDV